MIKKLSEEERRISKEWLKVYVKLWRENNPGKVKEQRRREKIKYQHNRISQIKHNLVNVKHSRKNREFVISFYGGECACCGEKRFEFLAIDHLNGDGSTHRKKIKGRKIADWLLNNGLPDGFRVLCHNCNMAIGIYGKCPHGSPL